MKNKKLKITILDFDHIKNPLLSGGQARATFEVAKRLVEMGHDVSVICSKYPGYKNKKINGIYYYHIGIGSNNLQINSIAYLLSLPFSLRKLKPDVVFECFMAPISTCFSPLYTKSPVIAMPTMFEAEEFAKKYHIPFQKIEAFGCKFYKYFLAYSNENKIKMEKYNPKIYTKIIPNGVSETFFNMKTTTGNYGLFIGRIDFTQKGLDLLIEACGKIKNFKNFKIIIAGNGSATEEKKLLELIKMAGFEKNIFFAGRVDGKIKESLIANCAFGLYPSRFEDFPLVPLEYASFGKPLVCFDIKGLAWVPKDISIKARKFDISELAKAIEIMFKNKKILDEKSKKCRNFARKYGWDEIAKKYEKFCFEVLDLEEQRRISL